MVRTSGVILAAGRGTRFGGHESKVWALLAGKPLLQHALDAFVRSEAVEELVVVVPAGDKERAAALEHGLLPMRVVVGGKRRFDSAQAGLVAARGEYALFHDGARPLVSSDLIRRVSEAAQVYGAAVATVPVSDTVRYLRGGGVTGEVDRSGLVLIQTPQGFRRSLLADGYARASERGLDLLDDAAAVLLLGHPVAAVPGEPTNVKVTRPEDLDLVQRVLGRAG